MRFHRIIAVAAAVTCAVAVAVASPAGAATYELSGTQVSVTPGGEWALNYGGLLGAWNIDAFTPDEFVPPIFHGTGSEKFIGCLNLNRDGDCYQEPMGSL